MLALYPRQTESEPSLTVGLLPLALDDRDLFRREVVELIDKVSIWRSSVAHLFARKANTAKISPEQGL